MIEPLFDATATGSIESPDDGVDGLLTFDAPVFGSVYPSGTLINGGDTVTPDTVTLPDGSTTAVSISFVLEAD